jgi:hypothetical protein
LNVWAPTSTASVDYRALTDELLATFAARPLRDSSLPADATSTMSSSPVVEPARVEKR